MHPTDVTIRPTTPDDLAAVGAIYAHHVQTGVATFELTAPDHTAIFDTVADDTAVLQALFAEILAKPNGIGMQFFRDRILPRITSTVGAWLKEQIRAGRCADLPLSLLIPLLIAPISVHLLARERLVVAGQPVPDRRTVIEAMTAAFCTAAAPTSHRTASSS